MTVFLCENSFDGILTGVYDVYASGLGPEKCRLELLEEYEPALFTEYRELTPDPVKAKKVAEKIRSFMSEEAYIALYRASLHKSSERADRILRFIVLGLINGRKTIRMLHDPAVYDIFEMNRNVGREAHALREFCRFERLSSGIYYGKVGPENRVLELIADHFADRFPDMDWILYDEKHSMAALHSQKRGWVIREHVTEEELKRIDSQKREDPYTDLWKTFFETITIEERRNPVCQRTMLPLRYRKYMTEFENGRRKTKSPDSDGYGRETGNHSIIEGDR